MLCKVVVALVLTVSPLVLRFTFDLFRGVGAEELELELVDVEDELAPELELLELVEGRVRTRFRLGLDLPSDFEELLCLARRASLDFLRGFGSGDFDLLKHRDLERLLLRLDREFRPVIMERVAFVTSDAIRRAMEFNPHVPAYLLELRALTLPPEHVLRRGDSEALAYAFCHLRHWQNAEGALALLAAACQAAERCGGPAAPYAACSACADRELLPAHHAAPGWRRARGAALPLAGALCVAAALLALAAARWPDAVHAVAPMHVLSGCAGAGGDGRGARGMAARRLVLNGLTAEVGEGSGEVQEGTGGSPDSLEFYHELELYRQLLALPITPAAAPPSPRRRARTPDPASTRNRGASPPRRSRTPGARANHAPRASTPPPAASAPEHARPAKRRYEEKVQYEDRIRNGEIRRRTRVNDIAKRISSLKWQWAGHIRRPRIGKRSVGRPPTRWTNDLVKAAGSRWMQAAANRGNYSYG
ncbi:hypothetical protein MSG28_002978 [Choristoneura fumiferana]|uniref:Uncharacterized protein n=1 Tax=Choristoneura fumiferana TaxID=7141 RepID=A0ACC0JK55_CHOFU|nr:hypothetical protein MSG28_002978 [Choristoneura fumiferana]